MAGLAARGILLCLPRLKRLAQCLPRAEATRGNVLVCLPYQRRPHPQALSRTNGASLADAVGGDGALALARPGARPGNNAALRQPRSPFPNWTTVQPASGSG